MRRRESSSRRSSWLPARCCCWRPRWPGRRTARPPVARAAPRKWAARCASTSRRRTCSTPIPPLEYEATGWQVEYATALKLLNWKETKAQLVNEAASRFTGGAERQALHVHHSSRPSPQQRGEGHRAELPVRLPARGQPADELACRGLPLDLGSVRTVGKYTLVISLKTARPDFASIVSMPFFQAISLKTPIDPSGVKTPPSGGPYYISSRDVGGASCSAGTSTTRGTGPTIPT